MPTQKIDPKVIFASDAPAVDRPPVFSDKTKGMDVTRRNDGRPEIKEFNKLFQDVDLKILWLNENSVTPYNETIDYPDGAVTIKDGVFKILNGSEWDVFVDTSALASKDEVKRGIANKYDPALTYQTGNIVLLDDGTEVISTIASNTNDPNVDMTGWRKPQASEIFDESGLSQQELNEKLKRSYVTPYDFGYADGLDYGYYLQLAINSGNTVKGSFKNETVTAKTSVKITTNGQSVDLSMISVNLDNISGNSGRTISFVNLQPAVLTPYDWKDAVSPLPVFGTNTIVLSSATGLSVGDYVLISTQHLSEDRQTKTAFITEISGNTIKTDYVFGTNPTSVRVSRVDYIADCTVKMPQKLNDLSNETVDTTKMIGGIVVQRAFNCKIGGTHLVNGANPTLMYLHSKGCYDYGMQNSYPRVVGGGQGYVIQCNHSTNCESYYPRGIKIRHLVDYTGGAYNNSYLGGATNPVHTALSTHGAYEHDCTFHNMRVNDCTGVWGNYAVSFGDSDASFGNTSIRCKVIGGNFGGGFHISAKSVSCDIVGSAEFNTPAFNYISPLGGLNINVKTNAGIIFDSTVAIGDINIYDSLIANLVFQQYCNDVVISNTQFADIRTPNTSKPRSITVTAGCKPKPTLDVSNSIAAQKFIKFNNSEIFGSAVNAGYYFDCPIVSVSSDVTIRNSVNFHAVASNYFEFNGKFEDVDTRTTRTPNIPLVQQRSETGILLMNNPILRTSGAAVNIVPFRVASTSQAFASKGLIINGGYIEGITEVPNHVTLGKLDTISINGTLFNDDSAILAIAQTSKIKINGIKL